MSPNKRERDYARKRYENWARRQSQQASRRRRRRNIALIVGCAVVVVALVLVAVLVFMPSKGDSSAAAGDTSASASSVASDASASTSLSATASDPCPVPTKTVTAPATTFDAVANPSVAAGRDWTGTLKTSCGDVGLTLDGTKAPQAVANFITLANAGFYDNTLCHRLTTSNGLYVLQCGDPTGTGTGGPGYTFGPVENAPTDGIYPAGTIAMARSSSEDSMGSQFFITYADTQLADNYTVFGQVTSGLDVISTIASGGTVEGTETPAWPLAIEGVSLQ